MTSRKFRSSSPHEAVLSFQYASAESARLVDRALRPEVGDIADDRTRTGVERDDNTLTVTVDADDLVALRAGLNTWATLVDVAETSGGVEPA